MDDATVPKIYTVEEAAKILRIGRSTLSDHIRAGNVPHIRTGRKIHISQYQLDAYMGIKREKDPDSRPAAKSVQHGRGFVLQVMRSDGTSTIDMNLTEQKAGERLAQLLADRTVHGFTVLRGQ